MAAKKAAEKNGNGTPAKGERIAIVAGLRTPFAKQGTAYSDLCALELGKIVTSRASRARRPRPEGGRARRLRAGGPLDLRAEHRARDSARHRDAEDDRGLQREPRLRDVLPGDDERGRGDARRTARGRHRRRRRQRERRPHHGVEEARARARRGEQRRGRSPRRSARSRSLVAEGLPAGSAGAQGADDRALRWARAPRRWRRRAESGATSRTPSPTGATRARRRRGRAASSPARSCTSLPPPTFDAPFAEDNVVRKDSSVEQLRASSSQRSTGSTARSPRATLRRSPTAPPRFC